MPITTEGSGLNSQFVNSLTITPDITAQDGDVVVCIINASNNATVTDAGGSFPFNVDLGYSYDSNAMRLTVMTRVAGSSEPSSYTFGMSTTGVISGLILIKRGVDTASIYDVAPIAGNVAEGNTNSPIAPTITTSNDGSQAVYLGAYNASTAVTFSAHTNGFGDVYDLTSNRPFSTASKTINTAGAVGATACTADIVSPWAAVQFAFNEQASGGKLVSNFITAGDITNFESNVLLGAKGAGTNEGLYEDMYTLSQDAGRNKNISINSVEYDPGYAILKQMDYFDAQETPPVDYDQARWYDYAEAYKILFLDDYTKDVANFGNAGRFRYTEGLREMYLRKQANPSLPLPTITQTDMQRLRDDPAYSRMTEFTNPAQYPWAKFERVTSLYIQGAVDAEKCGVPRSNAELDIIIDSFRKKLVEKINQTTNYVGSYTRLDTMDVINYNEPPSEMKPWMMGLGIKAILDFYEWEVENGRGLDARVVDLPDLIYNYLEWLRNTGVVVSGSDPDSPALGQPLYVPNYETNTVYSKTNDAFRYVDRNEPGDLPSDSVTPDLNGLCCYGYFWLANYFRTKDDVKAQNCLDWGEKLWLGCLYHGTTRTVGTFFTPRQIGEQLRWAVDSLELRETALAATPDYLDAPTPTVNAFPTNPTVSAGVDRWFVFCPILEHSSHAVGLTSVTFGGQPMTLLGESFRGSNYRTCNQIWYIKEAGLTAATGNALVTAGGTFDNQASVHFTIENAYQGIPGWTTEFTISDTGSTELSRQKDSFTFMLMSSLVGNTPAITNPTNTDSLTFTGGVAVWGSQVDVAGVGVTNYSMPANQNASLIGINFRIAPTVFGATRVPVTIRTTEIRSIYVEAAQEDLDINDFEIRLVDSLGPVLDKSNVAVNGGGDYTINFIAPMSTALPYSDVGYPLWVSDGTNSFTTDPIPFLPRVGRTYVASVLNPNAGSEVVQQYGETFVNTDQCEYEEFSYPDRLPVSLDAALNVTIGAVPKDQTINVVRRTAAGVSGPDQYIDFTDGVAAPIESIISYRLRDANTNGEQPTPIIDEVNASNNLSTNYDGGSLQWGQEFGGRSLNWTGGGGLFAIQTSGPAPLFAGFSNQRKLYILIKCNVTTPADPRGRLFNLATSSGNGDLVIDYDATDLRVSWDRESGGTDRQAIYPTVNAIGEVVIGVRIDTEETDAEDRIQVFYNSVKQVALGGSTYPNLNSTINPNQAGRSFVIGARLTAGSGIRGKVERVDAFQCAPSATAIKTDAIRMLIDSDYTSLTPIQGTTESPTVGTGDSDQRISGTTNIGYTYPSIDVSGNVFNTVARGDSWTINTNPFNVPVTEVNAADPPTYPYTFYATPYRMQDNRLLLIYNKLRGHGGGSAPGLTFARIASDDVNFAAEYQIYTGTVADRADSVGDGFVNPANGEIVLFSGDFDDGTDTGVRRRWRDTMLFGTADAQTFTPGSPHTEETFIESRLQLHANGWPTYRPWDRPIEINGDWYQPQYGIDQAWMLRYDPISKTWVDKQPMWDNDDALGNDTSEISMAHLGEGRIIMIVGGAPANKQFVVRAHIDSNKKFQMIDDITDPKNNIQFTDTMEAGTTMRVWRIGDDIVVSNGERKPVYRLTSRRWYKEDLWKNPSIACNEALGFMELIPATLTPVDPGLALSDQGMPQPMSRFVNGVEITSEFQYFFYDTLNIPIAGDPFNHSQTAGYQVSVGIWEA